MFLLSIFHRRAKAILLYTELQPTEYVAVDLRALDDEFDPYAFMNGEYSLVDSKGFVELWKRDGSY